jgi:hypothetical protein
MGELNSKLLGIIFVMKFQAAAMSRANVPEEQRQDFTLYVDEFQNFATDSFETILSEARKYRLTLVLGNQFMTQLKEEIREAIIGNVGTSITGRIGITDAEIMVKKYTPTFDAEDLTKLPNFESVCVAQIQGVPSAPFSMSWIPAMGHSNQQLSDALKRLSAAKYGRPRAQVEKDIFARLRPPQPAVSAGGQIGLEASAPKPSSGSSFLDEWLAKRKQLTTQAPAAPAASPAMMPSLTPTATPPAAAPQWPSAAALASNSVNTNSASVTAVGTDNAPQAATENDTQKSNDIVDPKEDPAHLDVRSQSNGESVSLKLR